MVELVLITTQQIVMDILAVAVVVVIGLLFNPKMRRLMGLKTLTQESDNAEEEHPR